MQINKKIPLSLMPFFRKELADAEHEFSLGNYAFSWRHLERAHILGQPYSFEHTLVHWKMLSFAIRIKNISEIMGQFPRLLFGGVKSFVGHIPVGNTGGADVPALKPMEIPNDLASIIERHKH